MVTTISPVRAEPQQSIAASREQSKAHGTTVPNNSGGPGQDGARLADGKTGAVNWSYSGIQTPNNQKPHWLNPGFQMGVSW
jgi:hypothetical protein